MRLEEAYAKPVERTFSALESSEKGLAPKEAERRFFRYGPNILIEEERFQTLRLLLAQFKNLFIPLLLVASTLSFFFESVANGVVLLLVVVLNVGVSFFQERKAEKTLHALRKVHPTRAEVVRAGKTLAIPVEELVIGDVVVLRAGESVPADLRLFDSRDLKVDESVLTGESVPSEKTTQVLTKRTPLAERENIAYTGTSVTSGIGKGVVTQTGLATEFGKIASFVQEQQERSLLLERVSHLGVWLVGISALLALSIFVLGFIHSHEFVHTLNFAIALFVSAVPESLPTITTLALASTALRLSRKGALVRHLPTVEALSGVNLFAFDKTGTLTRNEMAVARIVLPSRELEVTGAGFSSEGKVLGEGENVSVSGDAQLKEFVEAGALGATASIAPVDGSDGSRWTVHGDPTEGAFLVLAQKVGLGSDGGSAIREIAFTSERRMSTRVLFQDNNLRVYSLGAPEAILPKCRYCLLKGGKVVEISPARLAHFEKQAAELARNGYRVLAAASKKQKGKSIASRDVERDLTFIGFGGLLDRPKERVSETFTALMEAGIRPVIITGDHPGTALAVARELGLKVAAGNVLSGSQIDGLTDQELLETIPRITIYARITPSQKYRLVEAFKQLGHRVAVSGDGANDAPALKKADVGVVMGEKGTDVSKEAADLVLLDDKIETTLPAIMEARTLYDNIKKFFVFLLSGNFDELLVIAWAFIAGLPQPFTILQILWINLISDTFPALALAYDPPSGDVLKGPPRELGPRMIRPIIGQSLLYGLLDLACDIFIVLFYLPDVDKMRTALFTQVVFFELLIIFSIRTSGPFWKNLFKNKHLLMAVGVSALLQILLISVTSLHSVLGITSLAFYDWAVIVGVAVGAFLIAESVKWVWRRKKHV
jgi:Ca2+-transporting ATPase